MKVLHVLGSIERSGAEMMLRQCAPDFSRQGIEFFAISTGAERGSYADRFEAAGIKVRHVPFSKRPSFFIRLAKAIKDSGCDVVHVHTERAALWIELTARLAGAGCVVRTIHNTFEFDGWLRLRRSLGRRFAQRFLGVQHVFISESVAKNERVRFGTRGTLIQNFVDEREFFPAGIDERRKQRAVFGLTDDTFAIISVGRCTEVKRHRMILSATASLLALGVRAVYLHIGSGEEEAKERRFARDLGIEEAARFLGQTDNVREVLIAADVFVMPSRYEGLPIAAIEAAACGLPLVLADVPGLHDLVTNDVDGLVVQNEKHLVSALVELNADSAQRNDLGIAGSRRALLDHSREKWLGEHIGLYIKKPFDIPDVYDA